LLDGKELQYLRAAIDEPKRPLAADRWRPKVSSKIGVLESLIEPSATRC